MLEQIYYVSQLVAVAALVPSIIYLAVQVHQNTAQARAGANYQFLEASGHISMILASDRDAGVIPDAMQRETLRC